MLFRSYTSITSLFLALALGVIAFPLAAEATPQEGSWELRVPGTQLVGLSLPSGIQFSAPEKGDNLTLLNLEAGLGYFVTDNFEVGGTVGLLRLKAGDQDASWGPLLSPFLRGFFMVAPRLALFGEGRFVYFYTEEGDSSSTTTGVGIDAGAEFFVTESWAIRVAPNYRHWNVSRSNPDFELPDVSRNDLGIGWGVAAYF